MNATTRTVATEARRLLRVQGHCFRRTRWTDWAAVEAVRTAAQSLGYSRPLERWAGPATSVTALTRAYLSTYACWYGIDASPENGRAAAEVLGSIQAVMQNRGRSTTARLKAAACI